MATTYTITRLSDASYDFTINLDAAFSVATTIRWEIHPTAGKFPLTLTTPVTGTVDFSTTDTTSPLASPQIPRNHKFPRDFEIQLYNDDTDALLFTSDAQSIAGDSTLVGGNFVLLGGGDENVVGLGSSDDVRSASGGAESDILIITRFQYGDVTINDTGGDENLILFDYGITITDYSESSRREGTRISSVELTLSTGAVITIQAPNTDSYRYQLGNDAVLASDGTDSGYQKFKAAIGASGTNADSVLSGDGFEVTTFIPRLPSASRTAESTLVFLGGGNDDIFSAASDSAIASMSGGVGNDTYIITRFQYGNVTIDDRNGSENLIKFDYDVGIMGYEELSGVVLGNRSYSLVRLTLETEAVLTIQAPNGRYNYQLGDGDVLDYLGFKAAIGVTPTTESASANLTASDANYADELLDSYEVIFNAPPKFTQDSYTFDVTDNAAIAGAFIGQISAADVDDANALTYSIKSGNSAGLFHIDADDGKMTLLAPLTQISSKTYNLVVTATDAAGNTDTATIIITDSAIRGTDGVNTLTGTSAADAIYGYGERDTLNGAGGDDTLYGGIGNDILNGGADADILYGDAGNDTFYGGAGHDTLYGGTEVDILYGEGGNDVFAFDIASAATSNADIVADFARGGANGIDAIRIAGASREKLRADTTSKQIITDLRTGENDSEVDDTVIYYTKGSEEIVLVVLEDFTGFNVDTMLEII